MTGSITNVLANGDTIAGSSAWPLSEINGEAALDVTYNVLVESVSGAPSAASLTAKLQRWILVGNGKEYEYGGQWVDLIGDRAQSFSLSATGTNSQVANIRYLNAFSVADFATGSTGAGSILLRDGSTSGAVLDQINLAAGASVQRNWTRPLHFPNGLLIHVTSVGTGMTVRGSADGAFDLSAGLLPNGDFPAVLADQSLAAPRLITRRVVGGMRTRLVLTPAFTGGTSPNFKVSATAITRL